MSRSLYVNYELERKRRLEIEKKEASEIAEKLSSKYQKQLEAMIAKGYEEYVPDEITRLKDDLSNIRNDIIDNKPLEARDRSYQVRNYIGSIDAIANATISQYERMQRVRAIEESIQQSQTDSDLLDVYYEEIKKIKDSYIVGIAANELEQLRSSLDKTGAISSKDELIDKITSIVNDAKVKVEELKNEIKNKSKIDSIKSVLSDIDSCIEDKKFDNKDTKLNFKDQIRGLQEMLDGRNDNIDEIENRVAALSTSIDEAIISEDVRREAVKSIFLQLKNQDFTVDKPKRYTVDGKDFVKIVARRPSGKEAICKIDKYGKLEYKFDNYDGMTCLKDIEKFNADLESIYSIKLSDERILWENPDRLSKDSYDAVEDNRRFL